MQHVSRQNQLVNRSLDAFSPLKRTAPAQFGLTSLGTLATLDDSLLDGISISPKSAVAKWLEENHVHHAYILSERVNSTRCFLGTQVLAGRDDVRKLSHILVLEEDQLVLVTMELMEERSRRIVYSGVVRRAHLTINKYNGMPHVLHVRSEQNDKARLFLDNTPIDTVSDDIDFPFMAFSQVPIGHVQASAPEYGLLTYKCRTTGNLYLRTIDPSSGAVGPEQVLTAPTCVGGVDFVISDDSVLFRIDGIDDNKLRAMTARSDDRGVTVQTFTPVDLGDFKLDECLPSTSPVFKDYHGNFHIPISALKGDQRHLLDVMSDVAVDTMILSAAGLSATLVPFPKIALVVPGELTPLGRGDGITDGLGIISTAVDRGKLLVSNSQSGGIHYPAERLLNHEMPLVFAFKSTECCYTRSQKPNTVSMDYIFLESDGNGSPISKQLFLETWDMPLPIPQLEATCQGNVVTVKIEKDAWFENGKTIFTINDPSINVISVDIKDGRLAEVTFDSNQLNGKILSFEMKSLFYWHSGESVIA